MGLLCDGKAAAVKKPDISKRDVQEPAFDATARCLPSIPQAISNSPRITDKGQFSAFADRRSGGGWCAENGHPAAMLRAPPCYWGHLALAMYVGQNVQSAPRCATEERPDVGWPGVGRGAVNCYTRAGLAEEAEAGIFRAASVKYRCEDVKPGELLDGHTPTQETDEDGGTCRTQNANPKGGRQTEGRAVRVNTRPKGSR